MKQIILAAAMLATAVSTVAGQTKTITGEVKTAVATVESIERGSREVVLQKENGQFVTATVPEEVKNFDTLKVGDKVNIRYYDNIVLRLKLPGEAAVDTGASSTTPAEGGQPGGTVAKQRTITATITDIDLSVPSITFKGPKDWTYSSRVLDKEALKKVKVGDRVDITWTEAVMISMEPPKK